MPSLLMKTVVAIATFNNPKPFAVAAAPETQNAPPEAAEQSEPADPEEKNDQQPK